MDMIFVLAGIYLVIDLYGFSRLDAEDLESLTMIEFALVMALVPWVLLGNVVLKCFGITVD